MPTIILNRNTANANIPLIPVLGFFDDFTRPDSVSLGTTPAGKPWAVDGGSWGIKGNHAAFDGTKAYSYATVDALTKDGTLTVKMGALGGVDGLAQSGAVLRYRDADNFIRVFFRTGTANQPTILHRSGGVDTSTAPVAGSKPLVTGSIVKVSVSGAQITVAVDGVVVQSTTTPVLTGTRHGLTGVSVGAPARFKSVEFTPGV